MYSLSDLFSYPMVKIVDGMVENRLCESRMRKLPIRRRAGSVNRFTRRIDPALKNASHGRPPPLLLFSYPLSSVRMRCSRSRHRGASSRRRRVDVRCRSSRKRQSSGSPDRTADRASRCARRREAVSRRCEASARPDHDRAAPCARRQIELRGNRAGVRIHFDPLDELRLDEVGEISEWLLARSGSSTGHHDVHVVEKIVRDTRSRFPAAQVRHRIVTAANE
jgi:hypothetical protein